MNKHIKHRDRWIKFEATGAEPNEETLIVMEWLFDDAPVFGFWQAELACQLDGPDSNYAGPGGKQARRDHAAQLLHEGFSKIFPTEGRVLPPRAFGLFLRRVDWERIAYLLLDDDSED